MSTVSGNSHHSSQRLSCDLNNQDIAGSFAAWGADNTDSKSSQAYFSQLTSSLNEKSKVNIIGSVAANAMRTQEIAIVRRTSQNSLRTTDPSKLIDSQYERSPLSSSSAVPFLIFSAESGFSPRSLQSSRSSQSPRALQSPRSPRSPLSSLGNAASGCSLMEALNSSSAESTASDTACIEKTATEKLTQYWSESYPSHSFLDVDCFEGAVSILIIQEVVKHLKDKNADFLANLPIKELNKMIPTLAHQVIFQVVHTDCLVNTILNRLEELQESLDSLISANAIGDIHSISCEELKSNLDNVHTTEASDSETDDSASVISNNLAAFYKNIQKARVENSKFGLIIMQAIHDKPDRANAILAYFEQWIQAEEGLGCYTRLCENILKTCYHYINIQDIGKGYCLLNGPNGPHSKQTYQPLQIISWDKALEEFALVGSKMLSELPTDGHKNEQCAGPRTPRTSPITSPGNVSTPRSMQTPQQKYCSRARELFSKLLGTDWGKMYTKELQCDAYIFRLLAANYFEQHIFVLHPKDPTPALKELLNVSNGTANSQQSFLEQLFLDPLQVISQVEEILSCRCEEKMCQKDCVRKFYNALKPIMDLSENDQQILARMVADFIEIILMSSTAARKLGEDQMYRHFPDLFEECFFKNEAAPLPHLKLSSEAPYSSVEYQFILHNSCKSLQLSQQRRIPYLWSLQRNLEHHLQPDKPKDGMTNALEWQGKLHIKKPSVLVGAPIDPMREDDLVNQWHVNLILSRANQMQHYTRIEDTA